MFGYHINRTCDEALNLDKKWVAWHWGDHKSGQLWFTQWIKLCYSCAVSPVVVGGVLLKCLTWVILTSFDWWKREKKKKKERKMQESMSPTSHLLYEHYHSSSMTHFRWLKDALINLLLLALLVALLVLGTGSCLVNKVWEQDPVIIRMVVKLYFPVLLES